MMSIPPMGNVPMGTIVAFALDKIPPGWLPCNGSPIPAQYEMLMTALNSRYTPNLAGRTLIGTGVPNMSVQDDGRNPNYDSSNVWSLGFTGGEYQHVLDEQEIPTHSHTINNGQFGTLGIGLETKSGSYIPYCTGDNPKSVFGSNGTDSTGGGTPHFNMQPYQAVHYIIYTGLDS